jgi:hypothetical protein
LSDRPFGKVGPVDLEEEPAGRSESAASVMMTIFYL